MSSTACPNHEMLKFEDEIRPIALRRQQKMIIRTQFCTRKWTEDAHTQTHHRSQYIYQEFFGIPNGHLEYHDEYSIDNAHAHDWPGLRDFLDQLKLCKDNWSLDEPEFPYGQLPFEVFLNCAKTIPHHPPAADIPWAFNILRSKGLLPELVLSILGMAGYDHTQRRLPVAHDPFHPDNREELKKYLTFCWLTLIRCNIFAQDLKVKINWKRKVLDSLLRFVGPRGRKELFENVHKYEPDRRDINYLSVS
ncbi:hypothetical protein AN3263.2 [Aspergillus nidulans FGSC A4]|jgi:hypothetical protein|uniref:Uncharacterized protein n=1 Tax=Emericella nidulans (strain FGSC A4 / ATCC 38163 / CBS 112.46 / NRRL 194 / M139) TaxID=227321 RepID=Q5B867_EMENI|nr:hypothetical protein [Aspergillus nidulans FGSC A4]EAA63164.1 hypothetical protein AN3263.2 [Aspergillus nidulans FGSC A4]CBF83074.1 TPA: conserved hypothetical protein [Aspergillus nidulans FGSC A4]|eukprot:XP_660867.1 hypothetical protein AN3263.2 [Aspergillus nidulans FGSC A4]